MPDGLEIRPVRGMGDIRPGADLAAEIVAAAPWLRDGDVLVVTSKIVSKAEGRLVDVPTSGPEREAARDAALQAETARPVARRGGTRIVQTHHGFVMASAGIDASNVDRSRLVLLPKDPDASARALRQALRERYGLNVAVIVSDTMGRPWRTGLTDVALGAAGLAPVRDHRGERDAYGNDLHITQMAVIDELSAAADLVKGKSDQLPVAVVRGYLSQPPGADGAGAAALVRDAAQDLFSLGTAEAYAAGLRDAARLSDAAEFAGNPVDDAMVTRTVAGIDMPPGAAVSVVAAGSGHPDLPAHTTHVVLAQSTGSPVAFGAALHRLRCALAAEGLATVELDPTDDTADGMRLAVGAAERTSPASPAVPPGTTASQLERS
jgi:coenzyme F420-0:L-glutamate ligase/coenzyme F420-1:gamma-L-glutamate ligase